MTAGRARRCRETGWWLTNVSRLWNLGSPVWWLCLVLLTTEGLWGGSVTLAPRLLSPPTVLFPSGQLSLDPFPFFLFFFASLCPLFFIFSLGLRVAELWDEEVQTCLTFLDPSWRTSWQLLQNASALSTDVCYVPLAPAISLSSRWWGSRALSLKKISWCVRQCSREMKGLSKVSLVRVGDVFCWAVWEEGLGTLLYIWQIDFCQQLSSDRLPVFQEEDQICGSMLCAGWTPKHT